MEIKIQTTEKKLSKSLIKQMMIATTNTVIHGIKHGFVVNVVKDCDKSMLITHNDNHFTFPMSWKKGEKTIYRRIGKFVSSREFNSLEDCDKFWKSYQEIIKCLEQIYI